MPNHEKIKSEALAKQSSALSFKLPDSDKSYSGECNDISGSAIIFTGDLLFDIGMALEITVSSNNALAASFKAYVEIVRSKVTVDDRYQITAEIKGIREF